MNPRNNFRNYRKFSDSRSLPMIPCQGFYKHNHTFLSSFGSHEIRTHSSLINLQRLCWKICFIMRKPQKTFSVMMLSTRGNSIKCTLTFKHLFYISSFFTLYSTVIVFLFKCQFATHTSYDHNLHLSHTHTPTQKFWMTGERYSITCECVSRNPTHSLSIHYCVIFCWQSRVIFKLKISIIYHNFVNQVPSTLNSLELHHKVHNQRQQQTVLTLFFSRVEFIEFIMFVFMLLVEFRIWLVLCF